MTKTKKITPIGYLILTLIALIFIAIALLKLTAPPPTVFNFFIRLFALWGYTAMAIAATFTPFLKEITKIFGKSFIKLHHFFAFSGLALITLHPISSAIEAMDLSVFVPVFDSWLGFWVYAGRPALILLYIALIAALFRRKIKPWRIIHGLMYVVLLFGFVHGILIGTDFANLGILVIFSVLFGLVTVAFIAKRAKEYRIKNR
ncbi:MAG: hypothetical protein ACQEP5_01565 [Actinomycetota bacterium]